ncbi:MAG: hypothetical protein IPK16_11900 [Anaerolineales bacterium]|nr:hypothetical protein [Anaerolineales bacterium]
MSFLKGMFGNAKLDGMALANSTELKEYSQIDLLSQFVPARTLHDAKEQRLWTRVLPRPYTDTIALFEKQAWLAANAAPARMKSRLRRRLCPGLSQPAGSGESRGHGQGARGAGVADDERSPHSAPAIREPASIGESRLDRTGTAAES